MTENFGENCSFSILFWTFYVPKAILSVVWRKSASTKGVNNDMHALLFSYLSPLLFKYYLLLELA